MSTQCAREDQQIQKDVESELAWDPSVADARIRVTVADGVATLRGSIPHYSQKDCAERAALRVCGVRGVANEVEVVLPSPFERSDEDIARAALAALEWNYQVPAGVTVSVDRAWLTLRGETEWDFEREAATKVTSSLIGVRGVTNRIVLRKGVEPVDIASRIKAALERSALAEVRSIGVAVDGGRVTLTGKVHSRSDIESARRTAWSCPGVMVVDNDLELTE